MTKKVLNILIYLVPVFLIAGIIDYRFHNYFWPDLNFFRIIPSLRMFDFFSIFDAFLLLVFAGYLISPRIEKKVKWIDFTILFLIIGLILSRIFYVQIEPSIKSYWFQVYINYANPILLFFVLMFSLKDVKVFKNFSNILMIVFGFFGLVILFEYFTGLLPGETRDFLMRLAWPYIDPFFGLKAESANWLSYLFGPMVIFASVHLAQKIKEHKKVLNYLVESLCIFISVLVLILTKSYTGIGVTFLIIALLVFINIPRKAKKYFTLGFVLLIAIFIATQYNTQKFQILLGHYSKENSIERREQIYTFNYEAFKENWLKGIGPGNYQSFFKENMEKYIGTVIPEEEVPPHPHNLVTHFWSDLGIFGLIAALSLYIGTFYELIVKRKKALFFLIPLYFLAHGMLDLPYGLEENSILFWVFFAIASAS
jgi:O-antigen ligase